MAAKPREDRTGDFNIPVVINDYQVRLYRDFLEPFDICVGGLSFAATAVGEHQNAGLKPTSYPSAFSRHPRKQVVGP
ncbi:MAG: hypothetical protein ACREEK_03015 [Bradyrhizobium sp.]